MKAASVFVSRYLYCIAFLLHIYYIINFLIFQRKIRRRKLVRHWGFEPQTYRLKADCSTAELMAQIKAPHFGRLEIS